MVNFIKKIGLRLSILLTVIGTSFAINAKSDDILIYIRDDVFEDYQTFVGTKDVLSIKDFTGAKIRRDVVDMIIAQQALKLGGFHRLDIKR